MRPLAFLVLFLIVSLAARAAESGSWQVWEDCTLATEKYFDGDSFHVRHGKAEAIIRLYFVDAPETGDGYGKLVDEQAAYFKVKRDTILRAGATAKQFTEKFLDGSFRVITRLQAAPGASRDQRYYGVVEAKGRRLDAALIDAGLARVSSEIADYPEMSNGRQIAQGLRLAEQQAAKARRGLWTGSGGFVEQLSDAVKARVPDAVKSRIGMPSAGSGNVGRVNLNTASPSELAALPGVGPKTAEMLIRARPIKNLEALDAIPGIGPKKLEALRDLVRFE